VTPDGALATNKVLAQGAAVGVVVSGVAQRLPDDVLPEIREFYDYWLSLPKHALVPTLSNWLDHAVPHLQPLVAISDIHSPTRLKIRYFGTGLVEVMGADRTGSDAEEVYVSSAKPLISRVAWEAVTRPCGYMCLRTAQTALRREIGVHSIALPLANPTSPVPAVVSYNYISKRDYAFSDESAAERVHEVKLTGWIDLGAGVPK